MYLDSMIFTFPEWYRQRDFKIYMPFVDSHSFMNSINHNM